MERLRKLLLQKQELEVLSKWACYGIALEQFCYMRRFTSEIPWRWPWVLIPAILYIVLSEPSAIRCETYELEHTLWTCLDLIQKTVSTKFVKENYGQAAWLGVATERIGRSSVNTKKHLVPFKFHTNKRWQWDTNRALYLWILMKLGIK